MLRAFVAGLFALPLPLAVAACAGAEPPPERIAERTAEVCVIRESRQAARSTMALRDNGRLVGATRGSSYVCWLASPGEHQLVSVDDDTGPILFNANAGGRYFLHQEISELAGVHAHLDWVTERVGQRLIDQCDDRVVARVNGKDDAMAVAPAVSRR